jgi:hypothetical protein
MQAITGRRRDRQRKQPAPRDTASMRGGGSTQQQRQNGPGNARAKYERYVALAREAAAAGDVIEMENLFQHAEHYFRVMRGA